MWISCSLDDFLVCNQSSGLCWADTGRRNITCLVWQGAEPAENITDPPGRNSLVIKSGSQSTLLFKKAPDREPEGTQIWFCVSGKENSKITEKGQVKSMNFAWCSSKTSQPLESHQTPDRFAQSSPGFQFHWQCSAWLCRNPSEIQGESRVKPKVQYFYILPFLCLHPNNCQIQAPTSIGNTSVISGYTQWRVN